MDASLVGHGSLTPVVADVLETSTRSLGNLTRLWGLSDARSSPLGDEKAVHFIRCG
jgi:hypothetical protein